MVVYHVVLTGVIQKLYNGNQQGTSKLYHYGLMGLDHSVTSYMLCINMYKI